MTTMIPSEQVQPGDRVRVYAERHYNARGSVVAVRECDALGRVDVLLDRTTVPVRLHVCDIEISSRPVVGGVR
jgi:hypothetical protein